MVGLVAMNSFRRHAVHRRELSGERKGAIESPDSLVPGDLTTFVPAIGGGIFSFENATLEVRFLTHDVVLQSWGPGAEPVAYASSAHSWPVPQIAAVTDADRSWKLSSDALVLSVERDGATSLARRDGTVLRSAPAPARVKERWEHAFTMKPGETFSGLGEQAGRVDVRGRSFTLWNTDVGGAWGPGAGPLYMGIPVVVSTHEDGDLLTFYENSWRSVFSFGPAGVGADSPTSASVTFRGGSLRYYTVSGDPGHLLRRYCELTGFPPLPPRWALGYHQSRWGYKTESDVVDILEGYRDEGLPLSAVHLDIDYMDGYRVFTVDRRRFPDLVRLCARLAERGIRVVTILDPGVKVDPGYSVYEEGRREGLFCTAPSGEDAIGVVWPGRAAFPDFTSPRTRDWWAEHYQLLADCGVAGAWHDMNEPASIALAGDPTLASDVRHDFEGRGGDHAEGHNLYGLLMNISGYEGLRSARPGRRPFIVSRSGWASNQRYAWTWTGDAQSTWEALRQQVATVVGLGLSGVAFSGSDTGGFSGVPEDELFLRWLQTSVFMGFCRTHSVVGAPPREPWRFAQPTRGRVAGWIRFRYRLLPLLYTLAHEASVSGAPLVRPLWWRSSTSEGADHETRPEDAVELAKVDDEFLLGDAILVAPVCEPGATEREVVLPRGDWTSIWAGTEKRLGGDPLAPVTLRAPLERPVVLARAGSILTLDDGFADPRGPCALAGDPPLRSRSAPLSVDHAPRSLAFHLFPSSSGEAAGVRFDDAGDGAGPSRLEALRLEGASVLGEGPATLTVRASGDFPPPPRVRVVLHGLEAEHVIADGIDVGATAYGGVEVPYFERLELFGLRDSAAARRR
jgi:alpha-glucosidase